MSEIRSAAPPRNPVTAGDLSSTRWLEFLTVEVRFPWNPLSAARTTASAVDRIQFHILLRHIVDQLPASSCHLSLPSSCRLPLPEGCVYARS